MTRLLGDQLGESLLERRGSVRRAVADRSRPGCAGGPRRRRFHQPGYLSGRGRFRGSVPREPGGDLDADGRSSGMTRVASGLSTFSDVADVGLAVLVHVERGTRTPPIEVPRREPEGPALVRFDR
jgi:hypothetical protein